MICPEQFSLFLSLKGIESIYSSQMQRPTILSNLSRIRNIQCIIFKRNKRASSSSLIFTINSLYYSFNQICFQRRQVCQVSKLFDHPNQSHTLCTNLLQYQLGYDLAVQVWEIHYLLKQIYMLSENAVQKFFQMGQCLTSQEISIIQL